MKGKVISGPMPETEKVRIKAGLTVFVVEDDEGLNYLIQQTLKKEGIIVEGFMTGADAVAKMSDDQNALLLLDYVLPDMSGRDVLHALAERNVRIPFIIITGHGDEKVAVEMMKLGARDYIVKSVGLMDILPHTVNRVIHELSREKKLTEAENALREMEILLKSVIEQSPVPMAIVAPDGTLKIINDACKKHLGVEDEPEMSPGLNIFNFQQSWKDYDEYENPVSFNKLPLAQALHGKTTRSREIRTVRKDGTEKWEMVDGVPILDENGDLIAGFVVFPDITENKLAREELNERVNELEEFYGMAVGRELKMKELKLKLDRLTKELAVLKDDNGE